MEVLEDPEVKIRAYLKWIEDPKSAADSSRIDALTADLQRVADPIERLHVAAELHEVRNPDPSELRRQFIAVSKAYAEERNLPAAAFLTLGVPASDLRAAGFSPLPDDVSGLVKPKKRVSVDDVKACVPKSPFSIRQLIELSGASAMTVRKALDEMLANNELDKIGPDPAFSGPGRAPARYERS